MPWLPEGNLRVAPETLGGETGVKGEGVHNSLLPHGHKAHTVHQGRPPTPGTQQGLDAGTVHRLIDPVAACQRSDASRTARIPDVSTKMRIS